MSIARQRREGAAALAILMRQKNDALMAAANGRDQEAAQEAALALALVCQNNAKFLIYVLERFAGTIKHLPGGLKRNALAHGARMETHESLVEAAQADMEGIGG